MKNVLAGIDSGGTKIALALATASGEILTKCIFPTQVNDGAHKILGRTLYKIQDLIDSEQAYRRLESDVPIF